MAKKPEPKKNEPLQITLLGSTVVLDPFALTIGEKSTWRAYLADLGPQADEADHMMALAVVMLQRVDAGLTWDHAKSVITWQVMLDAVSGARDVDPNRPEA